MCFWSIIYISINHHFSSPHKIHHHFQLPWTDRNYGNIFSIWDRIFSTLVQDSPQKVQYGLDEVGDQFTDGIRQLLVMPWVKEGRKLED